MGGAIVMEFIIDLGRNTGVVDQRLTRAHVLGLDLYHKISKGILIKTDGKNRL